jgi:hypothetical protein
MKTKRCMAMLFMLSLFACLDSMFAVGQVQVTSTSPSAAPQGTVTVNITINGSGFQKGAQAQWFVTGTTNPGGVTVNSTTFKGSGQLTANITVASDAVISGYDIKVTNTNGRTGKGTDLFAITQKGTPIGCYTTGTPGGATLVTVLNPVQSNGAALITSSKLGNAIRVRPMDLNNDGVVDTLAAFVTSGVSSGTSPGTYVFLLDPSTGRVQATNPVTGAAWQNPLLVLSGVRATQAAAGDVNGDGIPDFVMGISSDAVSYLFVGSVSGAPSYNAHYTAYQILPPPGAPTAWAAGVAIGDLDGDGKGEIVVSASPGKKDTSIPAVFIFNYTSTGVSYSRKIQAPTGTNSGFGGGLYGQAVAIANVDGNPGNELVVGAQGDSTNGLVYVFPSPATQSNYFTLTGPGPQFGETVGVSDVNLDGIPDLVVVTGAQFNGSDASAQALIFAGPVHAGAAYTNQLLPANGLSYSWSAPNSDFGDMLTSGAVLIGTPNASNTTNCTNVGAAHLFLSPFSASQRPTLLFEPPALGSNGGSFGYGVGLVPGYPFLLVGAHLEDVGTTSTAGQVYVYKLN